MIKRLIKFTIFALFVAILWVSAASPVTAKVVGILFDDSGSMAGRIELPAFGAQILAATVDGRPGQDRLLIMRLSDLKFSVRNRNQVLEYYNSGGRKPYRVESFPSQKSHQGVVTRLRRDLAQSDRRGTPYDPIEYMLHALSEEARDGEKSFLIIIGDGQYEGYGSLPAVPNSAQLKRSYEQYRAAMKGTVRIEYLLITAKSKTEADKLIANVKTQAVRPILLDVFNGDAEDGVSNVKDGKTLWGALKNIIARVSSTDEAGLGKFVNYSGNTVTVESPMSISRIVSVSVEDQRKNLPRFVDATFLSGKPERSGLNASMVQGDSKFGNLKMAGEVEHFRFLPNALPPGSYTLSYSVPVGEAVFLLFETQALSELRILDIDGNEAKRDSVGVYELVEGNKYRFSAKIIDDDNTGGLRTVKFSTLPDNTNFGLTIEGPTGRQTHSMDKDSTLDVAFFAYAPKKAAMFSARVQVRIPGFISPPSKPVKYRVRSKSVSISVSPITPIENCADCAAGEIRSSIKPGGKETDIAKFEVTAQAADLPGAIVIDSSSVPKFVSVHDEKGNIVKTDTPIPMMPGETKKFTLVRSGMPEGADIAAGPRDINIVVNPSGNWVGDSGVAKTRLKLAVPELKMMLVSHASDSAGNGPLVLTDTELLRGRLDGTFRLTDIISELDPNRIDEDFKVTYQGILSPFISFKLDVSRAATGIFAVSVRPSTSLPCLCFIGAGNWLLGNDERLATLEFRDQWNLQTASADLPMRFVVAFPWSISCFIDLLLLIFAILTIRAIIAWLRMQRYGKRAAFEIREGRDFPRYVNLRVIGNPVARFFAVLLGGYAAFIRGDPHEITTIQGLRLRSSSDGAELDFKQSSQHWILTRYGQSLDEIKQLSPDDQYLSLFWGDVLQNKRQRNMTMTLYADYSEIN